MSIRYKGGLVSSVAPNSSPISAGGVWVQTQATQSFSTGWPGIPDSEWENTILLVRNAPSSTATANNTFLDSSGSAIAITRNSTATQGSVSPFVKGWGVYLSSAYISTPTSADFSFGTGDFTIEMWINIPSIAGTNRIAGNLNTGYSGTDQYWCIDTSGGGIGVGGFLNTTYLSAAATTPIVGKWGHFAWVRISGVETIYINGVLVSTVTRSLNFSTTSATYIGAGGPGNLASPMTGFISNFRIVKGTGVYTSAFTPSTQPLTAISGTVLLTCQSNRYIDNSSNAYAITVVSGTPIIKSYSPLTYFYNPTTVGGSAYFNGTSDYLSVAANAGFNYSTGDFTWECWVYPTVFGAAAGSTIDFWSNASGAYIIGQCQLQVNTTGTVQFYYATTVSAIASIVTTAVLPLSTWSHIAVVRSGSGTGNLKIYINGIVRATSAGAVTQSLGSTGAGAIGRQTNVTATSYFFIGYIANVRIVKGTAVYTAAFTPPSTPVTAISGTSLLLNFANAAIVDSAGLNNIVTTNTAATNTTAYKYAPSSIATNASSSLTINDATSAVRFATNDFTIEGWFSITTLGAQSIVSKGAAATGWTIGVNASNTLVFTYTSTSLTATSVLAQYVWYHFAVVRSGTATGNIKIYLNGVLQASSAGAVTTDFSQTDPIYVGAGRTGSTPFLGFLQDIRLTKGVARYTADFTPPATLLPSQSGNE